MYFFSQLVVVKLSTMYFKAKMETLSETYIIRKLLEIGPKYEGIIKFLDFDFENTTHSKKSTTQPFGIC
jgi:hypothetical protein